jgi:hypothetical protein
MLERFTHCIQSVWADPVGSKVISGILTAGILALLGLAWRRFSRPNKASKPALGVQLRVRIGTPFPHTAIVTVSGLNRSQKPIRVLAVEFKTLGAWSIPDQKVSGSVVPVLSRLPKDYPIVIIGKDLARIARTSMRLTLSPKEDFMERFRVVTDATENEGPFGIFPYLVSAAVILDNEDQERLELPNFVASLHSDTDLASITHAHTPIRGLSVAEVQARANAVLSHVTATTECDPDVMTALLNTANQRR